MKPTICLLATGLVLLCGCWGAQTANPSNNNLKEPPTKDSSDNNAPSGKVPYIIPVLVLKYFPVKGNNIDRNITGDWGASLKETRDKTDRMTSEIISALEAGSKYHGYRRQYSAEAELLTYKDKNAPASLKYIIVDTEEFLEPIPTRPKEGNNAPLTDYFKIMNAVKIQSWVEEKGVKEVWIWGYHGGMIGLWESNMAGPYGDVSNSNRDPNDLPVLKNTYTVYHYNYQRGTSEAVEDHLHQIEAVLNYVDGRDRTPPDKHSELLFWGKFVGSDKTGKIINPGCGWAHYPPNGEHDYDWANKKYVWSDIEDWKPDGDGKKQKINCDKWEGNSLRWFIYWMQNLPGENNKLTYKGKELNNWWSFIGDFDYAMKNKWTLTK